MDLVRFPFILAVATLATADIKTWVPNTNYGNPRNWDALRVPCASDRAVFPANIEFAVLLPGGSTMVRELVLPLSGELMLPLSSVLTITGKAKPVLNCNDPTDVQFSRLRPAEWLQPGNWLGFAGPNPAEPHSYRVPCHHDAAVFPEDSSFSVLLPKEPVYVRQISIQGQEVNAEEWSDFLQTEAGERQFLAPLESRQDAVTVTGAAPCDDRNGCECVPQAVEAEVCRLQAPLCGSSAPCFSPVRPYGHCCDICGAYVLLDYNSRFMLADLKISVDKLLKSKDFSGLASHVGKTTETGQIQVVLVDRGDYSSAPSDAARQLAEIVENRKTLGVTRTAVYAAGPATYPGGAGKIVADVFGPLFGVIAMLALFYLIFVVFGDKRLPSFSTSGGGSFVFARFDNAPDEAVSEETAMEASEDPRMTVAVARDEPSNAFDNPMFGKRSASKSKGVPLQSDQATRENPMFLELKHHSSTSEDTAEEELLTSEGEDDDPPSTSGQ